MIYHQKHKCRPKLRIFAGPRSRQFTAVRYYSPSRKISALRVTETIAKLARLGPAKNGTTLKKIIELTTFCIMIKEKSPRISCPEYIEDLDKCIKMQKRQCHEQIHDISKFWKIRKKENFQENLGKYKEEGNSPPGFNYY